MLDGNFGYKSLDDEIQNFIPKIMVMGVGGAGCNAVNNMIEQGIDGVEFVVANTDAQSLLQSKSPKKIQLGKQTTKGFGAGSRPEIGQKAAEESSGEIADLIKNSNILFLTAGMGGGTGSGALPVIASIAKEKGILTVAIVTTPFDFEGKKKEKIAKDAIDNLIPNVDSYIVLPNQNLYNVVDKQMTFLNAFKISDNVLYDGVRNITDLIRIPGTINLDFADIRAVMEKSGRTLIGTSVQRGENRALKAVEGVLLNPLLQGNDIRGAKSVLVNITANPENLSLDEPAEVMNTIRASIDSDDTNFYLGTCFDVSMDDSLKVAIIATGLSENVGIKNIHRDELNTFPSMKENVNTYNRIEKTTSSFSSFDNDINSQDEEKPLPIKDDTFDKDVKNVLGDFGADALFSENTDEVENFEKENSFDSFIKQNTPSSIDDFINREAQKISESEPMDLVAKKEDNDDDEPTPPDNGGGNGKKKSSLSSFFDLLGESKEDNFFDDVENFGSDKDVKLSLDKELDFTISKKEEKKEDDNVVFLAGSLDEQKRESQQTDLMEMIKKMEETLEIPAIFKKNNN